MKPKCAIFFSGQTRCYNEMPEQCWETHLKLAKALEEQYGFEVDFYGHTWTDCDTPYNVNDFKFFHQTDQVVIDNWVRKNLFLRGYWDCGNHTWLEFCDANQEGNGQKIIDKILENSRKAYGQYWSFKTIMNRIPNDYDVYFKTRWDTKINKHQGLIEFFPYLLANDHERTASVGDDRTGLCIFDGRSHFRYLGTNARGRTLTHSFINDTNFLIDKTASITIKDQVFPNHLDQVLKDLPRGFSPPSSHDLWTLCMPENIVGRFVLQGDCYDIMRNEKGEEDKKETNRWAI